MLQEMAESGERDEGGRGAILESQRATQLSSGLGAGHWSVSRPAPMLGPHARHPSSCRALSPRPVRCLPAALSALRGGPLVLLLLRPVCVWRQPGTLASCASGRCQRGALPAALRQCRGAGEKPLAKVFSF
jgi:hypothetical protein